MKFLLLGLVRTGLGLRVRFFVIAADSLNGKRFPTFDGVVDVGLRHPTDIGWNWNFSPFPSVASFLVSRCDRGFRRKGQR